MTNAINLTNWNTLAPEISLDSPERSKFINSSCQRFFHPICKRNLDNEALKAVKDLFRHKYHYQDIKSFNHVWKKIGADLWTSNTPLTAGLLQAIDHSFQKHLVYHGPGISGPLADSETNKSIQSMMRALLHGNKLSRDVLTSNAVKAVLINNTHDDSLLITAFRNELQRELIHLAQTPPTSEKEELLWRAYTGNILALLPFCYPKREYSISIPILIKNELNETVCELVDYEIEELDLFYNKKCTPMKALGLTAKNGISPPILSFSGTTYPGGEGFATTLLADFTPNKSVGQIIYERNHLTIDSWLKDKKGVHAVGASLGGALVFHTLHEHHEKLARIDAYNPPGLYPGQWINELSEDCSINIWCQDGDIVKKLGAWPTDPHVSLYLTFSHQKHLETLLNSHARVFYGCRNISILKIDPKVENEDPNRLFLTKLHKNFSWILNISFKFLVWVSHHLDMCSKYISNLKST